jgi:hypothetical protein
VITHLFVSLSNLSVAGNPAISQCVSTALILLHAKHFNVRSTSQVWNIGWNEGGKARSSGDVLQAVIFSWCVSMTF